MNEVERRERFEVFHLELPGVKLRIEPGTKLKILRKTIKSFYQTAKWFAEVYFHHKIVEENQEFLRMKIIEIVKEHEGLRGIISEKDNFILTVIPREKIIWDREQLKRSLGVAYSAVAREELMLTISIPADFSEEVVEKAIGKALLNLGIPEKLIQKEIRIVVDEKKITEMIEQGYLRLPEGAKTSEISWAVKVDRLKK
jgi:hypothetical protein